MVRSKDCRCKMSPLKTKIIRRSKNISEIIVFDDKEPNDSRVTYEINKQKKEIKFYPSPQGYPVYFDKITIKGFDRLPDEFNQKGYIKAGVFYYLNSRLNEKKAKEITVSKDGDNFFKKNRVQLNYRTFQNLKDKLSAINNESKIDKSLMTADFFHEVFPGKFAKPILNYSQKVQKLVGNVDENVIKYLKTDDVAKLIEFFEQLIKRKYKASQHKRKLLNSAKIKVDNIAIDQVIKEFEELLKSGGSESDWGEYLKKNLFLIDSKYVQVISELNVILARCRKVDFGLVDVQGYLDIFEIKKPSTALLAKNQDRGNYYWSSEATKTIVQAEKYLYNAERKASVLKDDIKREIGFDVEVIRPRAIIIMGTMKQLDNTKKKEDFRVLRMSLKNLEIILYDELLERIKIQKKKIFIE